MDFHSEEINCLYQFGRIDIVKGNSIKTKEYFDKYLQ